jgi:tetratricopeptide (TPR) repeat protein
MLGQREPARLALKNAIDINEDFPEKDEARRRLSVLGMVAEVPSPGIQEQLEKYLRTAPNDPVALFRLAELQEQVIGKEEGTKAYEILLEKNPLFVPALRTLAIRYFQANSDIGKAYDLAVRARQADPSDVQLAKILGILNYRRGEYLQATVDLKIAAKTENDAQLLFYLGESFRHLNDSGECREVLERVLALNPPGNLAAEAKLALANCS